MTNQKNTGEDFGTTLCSTPEPEYSEFYDREIMELDGVFVSGGGDVVIPEKHFGKFPWEKLRIRDSNISSLSAGGSPLRSFEQTICFWLTNNRGDIHPLLRQYRWVIPASLAELMEWCKENAESELKYQLRKLIGA